MDGVQLETSCRGNGRCIDGVSSFSCECDSGYTGELCGKEATLPLEEQWVGSFYCYFC